MGYVKQPFFWTHGQELDLIELRHQPARLMKGENGGDTSKRARLIAGRAKRGLEHLLVEGRHMKEPLRLEETLSELASRSC